MFFYRISIFIDFNKHKFVELYFNEQSRMQSKTIIFHLNRDEHVLFPFSIKRSKCNGSCNSINNPYAKLCVPYVVKNLNVNRIQDGHFRDCLRMGGPKRSSLPKICHTFSTMMKFGSCTLPKEDPKNIWITWHTPLLLLTSAEIIGNQQILLYQEMQI